MTTAITRHSGAIKQRNVAIDTCGAEWRVAEYRACNAQLSTMLDGW